MSKSFTMKHPQPSVVVRPPAYQSLTGIEEESNDDDMLSLHNIPAPQVESKSKLQNAIIASCSTLPNRVNNPLFKATILSLVENERISKIVIHYPRYCERLKKPYPEVPKWMRANRKIVVDTTAPDFGPLTNVLPLLDGYDAKSDIGIFLFHDDFYYPTSWINDLLDGFESHNRLSAVGKQGSLHKYVPFQFKKFNQTMNEEEFLVMKTHRGVIYPFKIFPASSKLAMDFVSKYKEQGALTNPDVILASWCHKENVKMFVLPTKHSQIEEWNEANETATEDDFNLQNGSLREEAKLMQAMQKNDDFPVPWSEIGSIIGIVVGAILLILFLAFLMRS